MNTSTATKRRAMARRQDAIIQAHAISILCDMRGYSEDEVSRWIDDTGDEYRDEIVDELDRIDECLRTMVQTLEAFRNV